MREPRPLANREILKLVRHESSHLALGLSVLQDLDPGPDQRQLISGLLERVGKLLDFLDGTLAKRSEGPPHSST